VIKRMNNRLDWYGEECVRACDPIKSINNALSLFTHHPHNHPHIPPIPPQTQHHSYPIPHTHISHTHTTACTPTPTQVYEEVKGEVSSALLALIQRERDGEAVDQSLIAAAVDVLDSSALAFGMWGRGRGLCW
jgi:hypothetical protein